MSETPKARSFSGEGAAQRTAGKARRERARSFVPAPPPAWRAYMRKPENVLAVALVFVFAVLGAVVLNWGRSQIVEEPGRLATRTYIVRADFELEDPVETARRREITRSLAPRVYTADQAFFQEVERSLETLPTAVADAETIEKVAPPIREAFGLTQERLDAVRRSVVEGEADQQWTSRVRAFLTRLRDTPVISREQFQLEQQEINERIELRTWDAPPKTIIKGLLVNVESEQLRPAVRDHAAAVGFAEPVLGMVVDRVVRKARPFYSFSAAGTDAAKTAAAESVEPVMVRYPQGRVIVARGAVITKDAHALMAAEQEARDASATAAARWSSAGGALAFSTLLTAGGAGYVLTFFPRQRRRATRMLAVTVLLALGLVIAVAGGVFNPGRLAVVSLGPVVLCAMLLAVAYDQRTALAIVSLQAILIVASLQQGAGFLFAALAGAGVAIWRLKDVRHRNTIIYAGAIAGGVMAAALSAVGLLNFSPSSAMFSQLVFDGLLALLAGLLAGFITLGVLPLVERAFDVTTGMTLIELRDPKQPLLRELQQRAPGTYSHSLTVATLAESAAEAIGADSLHVYVGALYHDIGKANKPDYFVENQQGALSRHEKLSPAMSLLVIVGHVKDGLELAREHNLPRSLHHYIESHHGTTLVEYFFHAARKRADEEDAEAPSEMEYRYPGPRPRTKEAAILMICDATESASRAMSDPTPARIEALVQEIAHKRLADGQFDDCELTMRELSLIEASIVKSLSSIYHGRIAYPSGAAGAGLLTGSASRPEDGLAAEAKPAARTPGPKTAAAAALERAG